MPFSKGYTPWNKGKITSEETRKKLSVANKRDRLEGRLTTPSTFTMKGRKHSKESLLKISNANKGKITSEETRKKLSKIHTDKKLSKETRVKIENANRGKKVPPEIIEKIRKACKNSERWDKSVRTEERTKKILKSRKWYRHSKEVKMKIGLAQSGHLSNNWKCDKSFEPYGIEFNKQLKNYIRDRDQICMLCFRGSRKTLCVHHIDGDKKITIHLI